MRERSRVALAPLVNQRAVDLLRAAAEAELPLLSRLPPVGVDMEALAGALDEATVVAPQLPGCRVGVSRVLGERALLRGTEIWIGAVSIEHAVWMAAEKATVVEVEERHRAFGSKAVELRARALLGERARGAGRGEAYERWLLLTHPRPAGAPPSPAARAAGSPPPRG